MRGACRLILGSGVGEHHRFHLTAEMPVTGHDEQVRSHLGSGPNIVMRPALPLLAAGRVP
jgi:hypothetical protein